MNKSLGILVALVLAVGLSACDTAGRQAPPADPAPRSVAQVDAVPQHTMCRGPNWCLY